MRIDDGRRSDNIEDRRGARGPRIALGGGIGAVALALVAWFLGVDPREFVGGEPAGIEAPAGDPRAARSPEENKLADFVSVVLADTEDTWRELFGRMGKTYRQPKLVLFTGAVESGCGIAGAAVGPFYCPADERVYIDLGFYRELRERFRAPGDFAQAYVIAHEVGHHVQKLLGIADRVAAMRGRLGQREWNDLSVRLELQADFLAGVWAHHADRARHILEGGDIEEALGAASAIGDDRLQREARGRVTPDSFTHGTSAQRARWFRLGFETGDIERGDTFSAKGL